jgi:cytochrome c peroxidase
MHGGFLAKLVHKYSSEPKRLSVRIVTPCFQAESPMKKTAMIANTVQSKRQESPAFITRVKSRARSRLARAKAGAVLATILFLSASAAHTGEPLSREPITPVPLDIPLDQRKVALGRTLFNDSRLSGGNGLSCASCHFLEKGMTDGVPISRGRPGHPGITNTLSLFNVGLSAKFSWSGQHIMLEDQTEAVIKNPRTMGAKWDEVLALLKHDSALTTSFQENYSEGLAKKSVIDALVEYQKSLSTPNAPFDRYLRGDEKAISAEAQVGYQLFKSYGCASCHQGVNVGGNMVQVFGIFGNPRAAWKGPRTPGAAENSGLSNERPVFRVPVLRNVEMTAPYFHDGSVDTLRDAISVMAEQQLGRTLAEDDVAKIEAFLKSLSGEFQGVSVGDL